MIIIGQVYLPATWGYLVLIRFRVNAELALNFIPKAGSLNE